jgi:hypothetical protein
MDDIAVEVASSSPNELAELTRTDADKWAKIIKELNLTTLNAGKRCAVADVRYCPESDIIQQHSNVRFVERRCSKTEEDFFGLVALIRTPRCSISQGPV